MRVRNISWTFSDQLSFHDERTGGVCIHQNLIGVVFEDVPIGALLQFFLNGRPFDNLTGLFDPIERDGLNRNGVYNAESTKPYDYGVERGVVLNESHVWNVFIGISYTVGGLNAVDGWQAVGTESRTDESHTVSYQQAGE